jgi:hypothetical protein
MTLSGKSDSHERAEAARAARQARAAAGAAKRPWLMPLVVGVAIAALAFVVIVTLVVGARP